MDYLYEIYICYMYTQEVQYHSGHAPQYKAERHVDCREFYCETGCRLSGCRFSNTEIMLKIGRKELKSQSLSRAK